MAVQAPWQTVIVSDVASTCFQLGRTAPARRGRARRPVHVERTQGQTTRHGIVSSTWGETTFRSRRRGERRVLLVGRRLWLCDCRQRRPRSVAPADGDRLAADRAGWCQSQASAGTREGGLSSSVFYSEGNYAKCVPALFNAAAATRTARSLTRLQACRLSRLRGEGSPVSITGIAFQCRPLCDSGIEPQLFSTMF